MPDKPIYVTQPSLAPLEDFCEKLKPVWDSGVLTHNGPLIQQFEKDCCAKLGLKQMVAVTNGTVALQMAIRALELKGEIITSPFTWVATVSAIKWEQCTPVFCDIDPGTLNMDVHKLEALITPKTVAIMPVHVFGNPCDVEAIESVARRHGLKVIYDAAHAIGSTFKGKSLLSFGDISATSFHATKLLNMGEGGGCITEDEVLHEKLKRIRFFGHDDKKNVVEDGFNGKVTEIHAALGLANLALYDQVLDDRKTKYAYYKEALLAHPGCRFQELVLGECNYSYFPVILESEEILLQVEKALNSENVFPRRYFYPSVNLYTEVVDYQPMPVSEDIAKRILCLPLYYQLSLSDMDTVIRIMSDVLQKKALMKPVEGVTSKQERQPHAK